MPRRKVKHRTGLPRIKGIGKKVHDVWVAYTCLNCKALNLFSIGSEKLLKPMETYSTAEWACTKCHYKHSKNSPLPYKDWPPEYTDPGSIKCQRFWQAFFRITTKEKEYYWKICSACGRVLPFSSFDLHSGWGLLERQMECRCCKAAINAYLNVRRTKQQLYESNVKRRVGDLLLEGENKPVNINDLFLKFEGRCFKSGVKLNKKDRKSWAIDHILPSKWLYPLTRANAALLSRESNNNKRDKWPSYFYTNNELIKLAKITGANLSLISRPQPLINPNIDVDRCVTRYLKVRETSNLNRRVKELKKLLEDYNLIGKLSKKNKTLLGYAK
jgi:hypothetical protein